MSDVTHISTGLANYRNALAGKILIDTPVGDLDDQTGQRTEAWRHAIPKRFWEAAISNVHDAGVARYLSEWSALENPPNLLIVGPVGTGKTWAAAAAVRPTFFSETFVPASRALRFVPVGEMLDSLRPGGPEGELERLCQVDMLLLDDIGTERCTDWTSERMYGVINRRWMEERPTVSTTNLSLEELQAAVGERTYSRLIGSDPLVLALRGPDRRRSRQSARPPMHSVG